MVSQRGCANLAQMAHEEAMAKKQAFLGLAKVAFVNAAGADGQISEAEFKKKVREDAYV